VQLTTYKPFFVGWSPLLSSETNRSICEMGLIKQFDGICVDSCGRAGSLALLENRSLAVSRLSFSLNHIDVCIDVGLSSSPCRYTPISVALGGDINKVFYHCEKIGGPPKIQFIIDSFQEAFTNCGLYDLRYSGYDFTWWNGREGAESIEECLDRFMASLDWSTSFPYAVVFHIDDDFSDHI